MENHKLQETSNDLEKMSQELLDAIVQSIESYNKVNPNDQLILQRKKELKDVDNVYVCLYNDNKVGLFKRYQWAQVEYASKMGGNLYIGIDSDYIGAKETFYGGFTESKWLKSGSSVKRGEKKYVTNCNMINGMSFDDMRLIMYNNKRIGKFELGKSTSSEMIDVLSFASSYYNNNYKFQKMKDK